MSVLGCMYLNTFSSVLNLEWVVPSGLSVHRKRISLGTTIVLPSARELRDRMAVLLLLLLLSGEHPPGLWWMMVLDRAALRLYSVRYDFNQHVWGPTVCWPAVASMVALKQHENSGLPFMCDATWINYLLRPFLNASLWNPARVRQVFLSSFVHVLFSTH